MKIRESLCLLLVFFMAGCAIKYEAKLATPPEIIYCFDTVGHKEGAKPFIYGGTCCCTPTEEVIADYKKNGYIKESATVGSMLEEYKALGIVTAVDAQYTNNYDEGWGHIVFGGKSMVAPTPGTQHYEDVLFGKETKFKMKRNVLRRIVDEDK